MEDLLVFIIAFIFLGLVAWILSRFNKFGNSPRSHSEASEQSQWDNDADDLDPTRQQHRELLKRELQQKFLAINYILRAKKRDQLTGDELKGFNKLEERIFKIKASLSERRYQMPNEKSGFVYIISNPSFRSEIVKIGMTCAVDPAERVRGLHNTSTPLHFDIQMLHYSENALLIEQKLHSIFSSKRVNARREFFYATPGEIREKLRKLDGAIIYFNPAAEASEINSDRIPSHRQNIIKNL